MRQRKLSGAVGGGVCAASFALFLGSVASHLTGPGLYLFLAVVFLLGVVLLFVPVPGPGKAHVPGDEPGGTHPPPTLPPPSLSVDHGTYSRAPMEAEIREPSVAGGLLRISVRSKIGRDEKGKYYAEAFAVEGRFPVRLLAGPWRVPWNDAPAGRPRYIPWTGADLRLAEWPDARRYGKKPGGIGRARITFLKARNPVKRCKAWGTGPWRIVVRLRREGSDAYMDTAFDVTLESGQIVFQKA